MTELETPTEITGLTIEDLNFDHPKTEAFAGIVKDYFDLNQKSPFIEIVMPETEEEEDGLLSLNLDDEFHEKIKALFGDEIDEIMSDYFVAVISAKVAHFEADTPTPTEKEEK